MFDIDIEHFPGSSSGSGRCRRGSSYLAWDRRNGSPRALRDRRRVVEHPAARSQRRQNRAHDCVVDAVVGRVQMAVDGDQLPQDDDEVLIGAGLAGSRSAAGEAPSSRIRSVVPEIRSEGTVRKADRYIKLAPHAGGNVQAVHFLRHRKRKHSVCRCG